MVNDSSIIRSIRNLIKNNPTQRFFNSKLGSDVRKSLFDFVDVATASVIRTQILNTINFYDPRVENLRVQVDPRPDDNSFNVIVFFDIVGQDLPSQQFSFILESTR